MTQRQLAAKTGVDHTYLSKIENGELLPGRKTILAIAEALGANSDELLVCAGKVPADVVEILTRNPQLLEVIRAYEGGTVNKP